jgi:maltose O-acetyltransferase
MSLLQRALGSIYGRLRTAYYNRRYFEYKKQYSITSTFKFQGTDIRIYGDGKLLLGDNSYIGSYSSIQIAEGCLVSIGDFCMLSHNVRLYTYTDIADQDFRTSLNHKTKRGNIIIGDGVWIGANVFISPGVIIGNNSVVGANSVVTKDIPENAIYGGIPAKLIRFKRTES